MSHKVSVMCPVIINVDERDEVCGEEIEIEWDQYELPPQPNGHVACKACGLRLVAPGRVHNVWETSDATVCWAPPGQDGHQWGDEYDEGDVETEIISIRATWCGHDISDIQAMDLLDDLAVQRAERRAEGE